MPLVCRREQRSWILCEEHRFSEWRVQSKRNRFVLCGFSVCELIRVRARLGNTSMNRPLLGLGLQAWAALPLIIPHHLRVYDQLVTTFRRLSPS